EVRRHPEWLLEGDDARANSANAAGGSEKIDVVSGRGLHQLEVAHALSRHLAHEGRRHSLAQRAADRNHLAVPAEARRVFQGELFVHRSFSATKKPRQCEESSRLTQLVHRSRDPAVARSSGALVAAQIYKPSRWTSSRWKSLRTTFDHGATSVR